MATIKLASPGRSMLGFLLNLLIFCSILTPAGKFTSALGKAPSS